MSEFSRDELPQASSSIPAQEIAAALEGICASDDFRRSSRLTDLLRYIVTEEVQGRGHRLKAYSIATEVLGRKPDFDPSNDSIVRVEMARLRIALKLYYASAEAGPVLIDVPKGRYRPIFMRSRDTPAEAGSMSERSAELAGHLPTRTSLTGDRTPAMTAARMSSIPIVLMACLILVLAALVGSLLVMSQPKDPGERLPPLVLIAPVRIASPDAHVTGLGQTLQTVLVSEIANDPVLAVGFLGDERHDLSTNARQNRALYVLSVSIITDTDRWSVSANLQDPRTRTVLWSRSETVPAATADGLTWTYELSRQLAAIIGDPFGIVARTELASSSDRLPASRQCLIWLRQTKAQWTDEGLRRFVDCAARLQSSRESENAIALALMARGNYTAVRWLGEPERNQKLEAAWRQITRAQAIEPQLYLVEATAIRIAACRNDEGAVERMLRSFASRRPNNPQAIFEAAYLNAFLLNDATAAERLLEQGRRLAVNVQPTEFLTPALRAFQRGDMVEVANLLRRSVNPSHPAKSILGLIASVVTRDEAAYRSAMNRLAESGFRTPESIIGIVTNSCWNSQLKNDLISALRTTLATGIDRSN